MYAYERHIRVLRADLRKSKGGGKMRKYLDRMLNKFDNWFTSAGGVYQTLGFTLAIIIVEAIWPHLDDHGFLVLYWLTVYSAVTQPVLAHSNKKASMDAAKDADHIHMLLDKLQELEQQQTERDIGFIQEMDAMMRRIEQHLGQ